MTYAVVMVQVARRTFALMASSIVMANVMVVELWTLVVFVMVIAPRVLAVQVMIVRVRVVVPKLTILATCAGVSVHHVRMIIAVMVQSTVLVSAMALTFTTNVEYVAAAHHAMRIVPTIVLENAMEVRRLIPVMFVMARAGLVTKILVMAP